MKNIHLWIGGFCNPGSMQRWLDLSAEEFKKNLEVWPHVPKSCCSSTLTFMIASNPFLETISQAGHVCWDDTDILNGKPTGSIRVSLGTFRLYYPFRRRLGKGPASIIMLLKSKVRRLLVKGWGTNTASIIRYY